MQNMHVFMRKKTRELFQPTTAAGRMLHLPVQSKHVSPRKASRAKVLQQGGLRLRISDDLLGSVDEEDQMIPRLMIHRRCREADALRRYTGDVPVMNRET